ncbi:hypothetical protein R9C00_21180 [Flammeovirgaceae bacterium SG7u.111]|nr:hypothetical protein [Flammeovirgaceae bacterium SG7u.132]WPO34216.1 hypothetical protein R9C00_21180 [Flammeovirgaceae bacterium SG7u.111]
MKKLLITLIVPFFLISCEKKEKEETATVEVKKAAANPDLEYKTYSSAKTDLVISRAEY